MLQKPCAATRRFVCRALRESRAWQQRTRRGSICQMGPRSASVMRKWQKAALIGQLARSPGSTDTIQRQRLKPVIPVCRLRTGRDKKAFSNDGQWNGDERKPANRGLAEREGFEPPIPLRVCRISSAVLSTTQPPLRSVDLYDYFGRPQVLDLVIATEKYQLRLFRWVLAVWNATSSFAAQSG
jgi:hypothetical protein